METKKNPTGIGPMSSATSKPSKTIGKVPSGIFLQVSFSPILQLTSQGLPLDSTSTPKNLFNTLMSWDGTGTKAGIFLIYPSDFR